MTEARITDQAVEVLTVLPNYSQVRISEASVQVLQKRLNSPTPAIRRRSIIVT